MKGERRQLRDERVDDHVQVGKRPERGAPEWGFVSDLSAQCGFAYGGAQGKLC